MSPRVYRAETMAEALAQVKRDMGPRAVILRTRTVKSGGLFGVGARSVVEITAGEDKNLLPPRDQRGSISLAEPNPRDSAKGVAMQIPAPPATEAATTLAVQQELREIRSLVQRLADRQNQVELAEIPSELQQAYVTLIQNEVAEELASDFICRLKAGRSDDRALEPATVNEFLIQQIARMLSPISPTQPARVSGRCKVVALIGPTGVGKTTTVAKLAAQFHLKDHKSVGLITIDTYRIAAVEQLRTYARIIDIPLEVVLTPEELRHALGRLRDRDIVLIDTAGRSQYDKPKLGELQEFLIAAKPHEIHLVLSATCSRAVMLGTIERFADLNVNRVIFTKLDEAVGMGTLLAAMQKLDAKLSYVTTGQDVPNDIQVGDGRRLAEMILKGSQAANN